MKIPNSNLPAGPGDTAPAPSKSEVLYIGCTYVVSASVGAANMTYSGPGSGFIFFTILAGVSGILMLRQSFGTRVFCCVMLLLSLAGMWHEKEAKDTLNKDLLRHQLEDAQQKLQKIQPR